MKLKTIIAAGIILGIAPASICMAGDDLFGEEATAADLSINTYLPPSSAVAAGTASEHDASARKGVSSWSGWNNFRAEAQVERDVNDQPKGSLNLFSGPGVGQETSMLRMMGNLYYDFKNQSSLTPYVFGGLGAIYLEADQLRLNDVTLSLGSRNDTEAKLGYQAGAGFSYFIADDASLDVDYTYFVLDDPYLSRLNEQVDKHNLTLEFRLKF